ncbi:MAG TPA: hypothetical protein VGE37_03565, partial [Archangium sp.]
WDTTCTSTGGSLQDCYYASGSGCVSNSFNPPGWGYANSPNSACLGWSSKRSPTGSQLCTNPRLDRDNVRCDRTISDPTNSAFCGPENINIDNPVNGDTFVVGVNHYGNSAGSPNSKPHVNLYCNGERVISVGYNPATGQTMYPLLNTPGDDTDGDFWTVATIRANVSGGNLSSCTVTTVPSRVANPTRDGPPNPGGTGNDICVDNGYLSKAFVETGRNANVAGNGAQGTQPPAAAGFCKH